MGRMKNILLTFDDRLVEQAAVKLVELRACLSGDVFIYMIVSPGVTNIQKEKLSALAETLKLKVFFYSGTSKIQDFESMARASISYQKFFFPDILPLNDGYLLYLDLDTVITRNIDSLFNEEFDEPFAAVALDDFISRKFTRWNQTANGGVNLFNVRKYVELGLVNKAHNFIVHHPNPESLYTDLVLNHLQYNKWFKLDSIYNTAFVKTWFTLSPRKRRDFAVIHFLGKRKPWKKFVYSPLGYRYMRLYKIRASSLQRHLRT